MTVFQPTYAWLGLMCLEADPDRCHRKTIIARRLEAFEIKLTHLTNSGQLIAEQLNIEHIHNAKIGHTDC